MNVSHQGCVQHEQLTNSNATMNSTMEHQGNNKVEREHFSSVSGIVQLHSKGSTICKLDVCNLFLWPVSFC